MWPHPSLSPHGRDRQTLAPRAPNLPCDRRSSSWAPSPLLITGCLPAAPPPLTLHPLAYWYTSPQDRLRLLLGKAMGLQGVLMQSTQGENAHIIHQQHTGPVQRDSPPSLLSQRAIKTQTYCLVVVSWGQCAAAESQVVCNGLHINWHHTKNTYRHTVGNSEYNKAIQ